MATARAGRFSDFVVGPWLDGIVAKTHYLGLFVQDPYSVGNPNTVEITGAVYARVVPVFTRSGRILTTSNGLLWQGIQAGTTISHIGSFDAAFNGNLEWAGPIPNGPIAFPSGGFLTVAANHYFVGLDA
jgi:hypothetical protein